MWRIKQYIYKTERIIVSDYEEWSEDYDEAPQFQKLTKKKKTPRVKDKKTQRREKRKEKEYLKDK